MKINKFVNRSCEVNITATKSNNKDINAPNDFSPRPVPSNVFFFSGFLINSLVNIVSMPREEITVKIPAKLRA